LTYPSKKYEFVSLDDDSQYMGKSKPCSKPPTSDHDDLPPPEDVISQT
jgi:hypothetical protein